VNLPRSAVSTRSGQHDAAHEEIEKRRREDGLPVAGTPDHALVYQLISDGREMGAKAATSLPAASAITTDLNGPGPSCAIASR